jgi:hypothetical protein
VLPPAERAVFHHVRVADGGDWLSLGQEADERPLLQGGAGVGDAPPTVRVTSGGEVTVAELGSGDMRRF